MVLIIGRIDGANEFMDDEIREIKSIFEKAAEDAETVMQTIIATSGTPSTGRQGRVDTGAMLEGVNHRTDDEDDYSISVSFGWDESDFERPYPLYQENGFTHVPDGAWIPGMHALQDATIEAGVQIRNDINRLK